MGETPSNPFIGNPFMQKGKKTPPVEDTPTPEPPTELSFTPPAALDSPTEPSKQSAKPAKSSKKASKPLSKSASRSSTNKSRTGTQRKRTSQPAPPSPTPYSGNGYKVQVLAKIPMPSNPTMPSRDYLWFAVYPIIPRVGDCIFHDGRYFRVDAVFLYENTNAGWCADLEVSYYIRRH